jgi:hypothetical protein
VVDQEPEPGRCLSRREASGHRDRVLTPWRRSRDGQWRWDRRSLARRGFEVGSFQPSETITYAAWGPGGLVYTDATGAGLVSWPGLRSLPPLRMLTPGAPPGSEGGQLSRNGTLAWWATPKGVEIWNTRQRRRLRTLPVGQGAPAIALSDDSTRAGYFSPGQPMRIIEIASGRSVTLTGPQPACPGGWRWAVFSPDGHYISATSHCDHWGYLLKGSFRVTYTDAPQAVVRAGEAYHLRPGHFVQTLEPVELIELSRSRRRRWWW